MTDRRALVGLAVVGILLLSQTSFPTTAAWNDHTAVGLTIRAGTWTTLPPDEPEEPEGPDTPTVAPVGGISPGNGDTVLETITWSLQSPIQFCVSVGVTTNSTDPIHWSVHVDTNAIPWNGAAVTAAPWQGVGAVTSLGDGVFELTGTVDQWASGFNPVSNNASVTTGQHLTLSSLCVYGGNPPPLHQPGAETYTYTTARHPDFARNHACVITTIVGHSSFHVGFHVLVDWGATLDSAVADGLIDGAEAAVLADRGLTTFHGGNGTWSATRDGNVHTVRGTDAWNTSGIRAGQTIVMTACSN